MNYVQGMKKVLCALFVALSVTSALAAPFSSKAIPFSHSEFLNKYSTISFQIDKHDFSGTMNDKIVAINAFVNKTITYKTETVDVWSNPADTLARGYGDCDDFALLKMAYLFQAGFKKDDVSLMIVTLPGRTDYHAVVAVQTGDGFVILDSLNNRVLPDTMLKYIPVFQIVDGKGFISGKISQKGS
jgi:predicted transglutaminase-like cysteine proteinase